MVRHVAVVVASGLACWSLADEAAACSRSACRTEMLFPVGTATAIAYAPANLPAFGWMPAPGARAPAPSDLHLRRVGGPAVDADVALEGSALSPSLWLVRPSAPLVAGETYELTGDPQCTSPGSARAATTRVTVVAAAPLPTALGRLTLGDLAELETDVPPDSGNGSCESQVRAAQRSATLSWDATTRPWQASMVVQLYVDGAPIALRRSGSPITEVGVYHASPAEPVYTVCRGSAEAVAAGLAEGTHRFEYRARVFGSSTELRSNTVEAELTCGGGAGCSARPGSVGARATLVVCSALLAIALGRRRAGSSLERRASPDVPRRP
ncbi:MAG: hypothetical protein Q8S73_17160 [Deltaproteobacteria bacterium]|nr:hypothetical protein [Myxococcales bacterium]MDP3215840.1 hypothetical protein [Deltaproteobacteria bacterium]